MHQIDNHQIGNRNSSMPSLPPRGKATLSAANETASMEAASTRLSQDEINQVCQAIHAYRYFDNRTYSENFVISEKYRHNLLTLFTQFAEHDEVPNDAGFKYLVLFLLDCDIDKDKDKDRELKIQVLARLFKAKLESLPDNRKNAPYELELNYPAKFEWIMHEKHFDTFAELLLLLPSTPKLSINLTNNRLGKHPYSLEKLAYVLPATPVVSMQLDRNKFTDHFPKPLFKQLITNPQLTSLSLCKNRLDATFVGRLLKLQRKSLFLYTQSSINLASNGDITEKYLGLIAAERLFAEEPLALPKEIISKISLYALKLQQSEKPSTFPFCTIL